jgi:hypothetical protein
MIRFINILNDVISEQKRYKFQPEVHQTLKSVTEKLWKDRKKEYEGIRVIEKIPFKLADGTDGLVQIRVNPRLKYVGFLGNKPKKSLDPMDLYIDVNPKFYESKKNLYLTLYHEMIHASDPTQSHLWTPSYELTYDPNLDEKYWGHPIEFFAISNEFLEGLIIEFERRKKRIKNSENIKLLEKSFQNILNYFAKGEKLSNLSLDILYRINDEHVDSNKISNVLADIQTEYPKVSELMKTKKKDVPYFLHYVELIKKNNPKIWPRFLRMLYKVSDEIQDILK